MTLRTIGALAALISGLLHLWEFFFNGYDFGLNATIGVLFLLNGIAGIVIAILLWTWQHWFPLFLLFGFGALSLAGFIIAATVGLFGLDETWNNAEGWVAMVAEAIAVAVAIMAAVREPSRRAAAGAISAP